MSTPVPEVPSPRLVTAWLVVGSLATERVPLWAAHWLAAGYDGTALRDLAGLHGDDPHAVRDLLPAALAEAGEIVPTLPAPTSGDAWKEAYVEAAYSDIARLCLSGRASEEWAVDKVVEVVTNNNYEDVATDPPLGALWGMEDEWGAGWGRTEEQMRAAVRTACRLQLGLPEGEADQT